jgi:hypothetical protein
MFNLYPAGSGMFYLPCACLIYTFYRNYCFNQTRKRAGSQNISITIDECSIYYTGCWRYPLKRQHFCYLEEINEPTCLLRILEIPLIGPEGIGSIILERIDGELGDIAQAA